MTISSNPATDLRSSPLSQRRPRGNGIGLLREAHHQTLGLDTTPGPFAPHQHHRPIPSGQIPNSHRAPTVTHRRTPHPGHPATSAVVSTEIHTSPSASIWAHTTKPSIPSSAVALEHTPDTPPHQQSSQPRSTPRRRPRSGRTPRSHPSLAAQSRSNYRQRSPEVSHQLLSRQPQQWRDLRRARRTPIEPARRSPQPSVHRVEPDFLVPVGGSHCHSGCPFHGECRERTSHLGVGAPPGDHRVAPRYLATQKG